MTPSDRKAAFAALVIMAFVGLGFFIMPPLMMELAQVSPWLAYVVAVVFVLAFFAIFWLRAKAQRRRDE